MIEPLMQLQEVSFAYHRNVPVISGVSGAIEPGLMHALIGPNAAGKSTLLRLMLGELIPGAGAGRVIMGGVSVGRMAASKRAACISYVPQRASATFAFSVADVVRMGRFALQRDDAAVAQAMAACELDEIATRPFDQLSAGQQQRVLLGRAMAQAAGQGRLMLLDEPTSALDLAHVHRTMAHLHELARGGLAVVTVLHDLNLAARYADRVWLLDQGRLAAAGSWRDVLTPQRLEPVYRVQIRQVGAWQQDGDERPVFAAANPMAER